MRRRSRPAWRARWPRRPKKRPKPRRPRKRRKPPSLPSPPTCPPKLPGPAVTIRRQRRRKPRKRPRRRKNERPRRLRLLRRRGDDGGGGHPRGHPPEHPLRGGGAPVLLRRRGRAVRPPFRGFPRRHPGPRLRGGHPRPAPVRGLPVEPDRRREDQELRGPGHRAYSARQGCPRHLAVYAGDDGGHIPVRAAWFYHHHSAPAHLPAFGPGRSAVVGHRAVRIGRERWGVLRFLLLAQAAAPLET